MEINDILARILASHTFSGNNDLFLKRIRCVRCEEERIYLEVADQFHRDFIDEHFRKDIASMLEAELGYSVEIEWVLAQKAPTVMHNKSSKIKRKRLTKPGTGSLVSLPSTTIPRGLVETSTAEGNILEHPIFKLSNKEARPNRGRDKDGNLLFASEDYVATYDLGSGAYVRVSASDHFGFPTVFGMRVLLAIIEKSRRLGFPSKRVPITLTELAVLLGHQKPGGSLLKAIKESIFALNGLKLDFIKTWYDCATKGTLESVAGGQLITEYSIGCESPGENFVELSGRLFESIRSGYRIGIDLDYLNGLKLATAQRLYAYLTKRDGHGRLSYAENIVSIAKKLPLSAQWPSQIRRILESALCELECVKPNGSQFISHHNFEGSGRETQLVVTFPHASLRDSVRAATGALPVS